MGPSKKAPPEDGDRIQFPKRYVLNKNRTVFLDKNRTMDNVQKHNGCINVPLSQNLDFIYINYNMVF
jgi:hypothetical protein